MAESFNFVSRKNQKIFSYLLKEGHQFQIFDDIINQEFHFRFVDGMGQFILAWEDMDRILDSRTLTSLAKSSFKDWRYILKSARIPRPWYQLLVYDIKEYLSKL